MIGRLPIPPVDAERIETVCQYCTVGCGYTALRWPIDAAEGGLSAQENAFGVDLSTTQPALGLPYGPSMAVRAQAAGQTQHVVVVPAEDSPINRNRAYSSRGASNALSCFAPERGTRARLDQPLVRIDGSLVPVSWEEAADLVAGVFQRLIDERGPHEIAAKAFDHGGGGGGFENNWAIGKFFFTGVGTTRMSIHNRPAYNSEVWGSRDRGVHELHYSLEDVRLADTLVFWGANPYETATVLWSEHAAPSLSALSEDRARVFGADAEPARMVFVDPRRSPSVALAQRIAPGRVLHLRPLPGTDVVLADTLARLVWEEGWADRDFLEQRSDPESFARYRAGSLQVGSEATGRPLAEVLAEAERITGVAEAQLRQAAAWMAQPLATRRRACLTIYEKGVIWNQRNYDTVAAVVQLSALAGNLGRPGAGCGRQGGHQEGYVRPPAGTPRPPENVDQLVRSGGAGAYWVIGTNPYRSTLDAGRYRSAVQQRARALDGALQAGQSADQRAEAVAALLRTGPSAAGEPGPSPAGEPARPLFLVVSELYPTGPARDAHVVFPAAGWGEMNLTSISCADRLLRLAGRFVDPPGSARPDWAILASVAQALERRYRALGDETRAGRFAGFDWADDEAVFLEGGQSFPDNRVDEAGAEGLPAECYRGVDYAFLRQRGQRGIQTPVRRDGSGALVGTKRRFTERFATSDGRFSWHPSDAWAGWPEPVQRLDPAQHPFWLTTGRTQHIWQTGYHDRFVAEKMRQVPAPFVEMHPDDAARLGLEHGQFVRCFNDYGEAKLQLRLSSGLRPGELFALSYHPEGGANALVSPYTDPKTEIPWYKGTRVGVVGLAESAPRISRLQLDVF